MKCQLVILDTGQNNFDYIMPRNRAEEQVTTFQEISRKMDRSKCQIQQAEQRHTLTVSDYM
jgi:hypothetical protein